MAPATFLSGNHDGAVVNFSLPPPSRAVGKKNRTSLSLGFLTSESFQETVWCSGTCPSRGVKKIWVLISALPLNGLCDFGQIPSQSMKWLHQVIPQGPSSSGILWFSDSDQGQSRPLPLGAEMQGLGLDPFPETLHLQPSPPQGRGSLNRGVRSQGALNCPVMACFVAVSKVSP